MSEGEKVYDLEERLLEYAARIIRLVDSLLPTKGASHVAGQVLRSGTHPLAGHGEAQAAESIDDFIHKLKGCLKELQESSRWLRLIHLTPLVAQPKRIEPLIAETGELVRIFAKSIRTAEANRDGKVREEPEESLVDPWLIPFNLSFGAERLALGVRRLAFGVKPPAGQSKYPTRTQTTKARHP